MMFQDIFSNKIISRGHQIGHFQVVFSLSKRLLALILSYETEISFTCKFNSFSSELLYTKPPVDREAKGNSEIGYSNEILRRQPLRFPATHQHMLLLRAREFGPKLELEGQFEYTPDCAS